MSIGPALLRFTWTNTSTCLPMHRSAAGTGSRDAIFDYLNFAAVHLIEPNDDPAIAATSYATKLRAAPIDIVCCGIGAKLTGISPSTILPPTLTIRRQGRSSNSIRSAANSRSTIGVLPPWMRRLPARSPSRFLLYSTLMQSFVLFLESAREKRRALHPVNDALGVLQRRSSAPHRDPRVVGEIFEKLRNSFALIPA